MNHFYRRSCVGRPPQAQRPHAAQKGFTLIELLVVFTLIALLLSIAVPRYLNTVDSSRSKARAQNLATLKDSIDKFEADNARLPSTLEELVTKKYLKVIPIDPVTETQDWVVIMSDLPSKPGIIDVTAPNETTEPTDSSPAAPMVSSSETSNGTSTYGRPLPGNMPTPGLPLQPPSAGPSPSGGK